MNDEYDLSRFFRVIFSNFSLIFFVTAAIFSATLGYTYARPWIYRSYGTILYDGSSWEVSIQPDLVLSPEFTHDLYREYGAYHIYIRADRNSRMIELGTDSDSPESSLLLTNQTIIHYLALVNRTKTENSQVYLRNIDAKLRSYGQILNSTPNNSYEYRSAEAQISSLISKRDELIRNTDSSIERTKVIKSPGFPTRPLVPDIRNNLIMGVILGIMLGISAAYAKERSGLPKRIPAKHKSKR